MMSKNLTQDVTSVFRSPRHGTLCRSRRIETPSDRRMPSLAGATRSPVTVRAMHEALPGTSAGCLGRAVPTCANTGRRCGSPCAACAGGVSRHVRRTTPLRAGPALPREALQGRAIERAVGEAAIVIPLRARAPAFVELALHVGFKTFFRACLVCAGVPGITPNDWVEIPTPSFFPEAYGRTFMTSWSACSGS